jgi:uncharacterized cupin superfamily protein
MAEERTDHEMPRDKQPPAFDPMTVAPRTGSGYPEPFRAACATRSKRALGDAAGLTRFGVNLTHLNPGDWSAQRHWHSHEDEFVYVLEGELTLVSDAGDQVLTSGMAAGFPAGVEDGHCLINRGSAVAVYLEVGNRSDEDWAYYPDIDLIAEPVDGARRFTNRKGEPY